MIADAAGLAGIKAERTPWLNTRWGSVLLGIVPFAVLLLGWLVLSARPPGGAWQYAVPSIGPTAHSLVVDLFQSLDVWQQTGITLEETALGLLIATAAGLLIGVPIGLVRVVEIMFYPMVVVFQSVPHIALAPLLVLIFGYGIGSKVALAATLAFFPILVNVIEGMRRVRFDEIDLLRSLGASRWQVLFRVRFPRALPSIVSGIQVGLLFGLLGAVVGEFLNGSGQVSGGLGYLLTLRTQYVDIPGTFSALIVLSLVALALTMIANVAHRLISNWEES